MLRIPSLHSASVPVRVIDRRAQLRERGYPAAQATESQCNKRPRRRRRESAGLPERCGVLRRGGAIRDACWTGAGGPLPESRHVTLAVTQDGPLSSPF